MHSEGACMAKGGGMYAKGAMCGSGCMASGHAWQRGVTCMQERWPLNWAVHLLLECILVLELVVTIYLSLGAPKHLVENVLTNNRVFPILYWISLISTIK